MKTGLVVELKTGKKEPGANTKIHKKNMAQMAVQLEILRETEGMETPGLERVDYTKKDGKSSHGYRLDGKPVPGVTSVLRILDTFKIDEMYLHRGTWGHEICAMMDEKPSRVTQCWIDSLPGDALVYGGCVKDGELWRNWFSAYAQFKIDFKLENVEIKNELPFASRKMRVAATLDKVIEDNSPLRGNLLYITNTGYKRYELIPSDRPTSKYQALLNVFRSARFVYDFRGELRREHKELEENNEYE